MADPRDSAAWAVRSALRQWKRGAGRTAAQGGEVCVGLSGGADSLALVAAAVAEFDTVTALVVDHGLQKDSASVAHRAAQTARRLGARSRVLRVVVTQSGEGPEAAARTARYAALDEARDGRPVLLAHTLDDQAETVLLGLSRGSGARSLRGMTAWSEPWGRPLLGVRAASTRAACAEHGLEPWEDPHNVDPAFTRVRVRHEVMPLLEQVLGGAVAEALARTAELLAADDDALDGLARRAFDAASDSGTYADADAAGAPGEHLGAPGEHMGVPGECAALDVAELADLPAAVRSRVIHRWLRDNGGDAPTYVHVRAVGELVTDYHGQGSVAVGGQGGAARAHRRLVVRRVRGKLEIGCSESARDGHGG